MARGARCGAVNFESGWAMLQFGLVVFGFLMMFVLSSAARNRRQGRANPMMVTAVGYVLGGISAGAATLLPLWALYDPAAAATLASLAS